MGDEYLPAVEAGFYATAAQPLEVWKGTCVSIHKGQIETNGFYFDCSAQLFCLRIPTEDLRSEVYKCGKIWQCPGGLPQTCAGGREGVPCAECPQGENSFSSIFCEKTFVCVNMHLEST